MITLIWDFGGVFKLWKLLWKYSEISEWGNTSIQTQDLSETSWLLKIIKCTIIVNKTNNR